MNQKVIYGYDWLIGAVGVVSLKRSEWPTASLGRVSEHTPQARSS